MRRLWPLVALAGIGLGWFAYSVQIDDLHSGRNRALASVAVAWAFLLGGIVARLRRPGNRLGLLLLAAGFAFLARQFRYSHEPLIFTTFFAVGELPWALFAHAALAYPSGHVKGRVERLFVRVTYATVLSFGILTLLFHGAGQPLRFFDPSRRKSLLVLVGDAQVVNVLQKAFVIFGYGFLAAVFIALVVRKLVLATPRARRLLAPLMVAAVAAALRAVFESALTFWSPTPIIYHDLFWWQIGALIALPLALLWGLLQARLARAGIGDLVVRLEEAPPDGIRDELARALNDPSLEVALWLPERREFVDARGAPVSLPEDDPTRAVTKLEHDGEPLAVLIHDPSLREDPALVEAAGAAARLALENARLHAEVLAQLTKVKESRTRLVAAADEQRRRIERDLHDGAQQRLVALALELRSAQQRLGRDADPEIERLIASAGDQLQVALSELRELARGIHPAILTESGLAAALEALADRSPLSVTIDAAPERRLAADVEATAYFVACEALTNVAKHARASHATIGARAENGVLVIEVEDDGIGGAQAENGSGLRGLADRVEAHGGRLRIESPSGGGTRIVGEIPCAS